MYVLLLSLACDGLMASVLEASSELPHYRPAATKGAGCGNGFPPGLYFPDGTWMGALHSIDTYAFYRLGLRRHRAGSGSELLRGGFQHCCVDIVL